MEALQEQKTLAEIASEYEAHMTTDPQLEEGAVDECNETFHPRRRKTGQIKGQFTGTLQVEFIFRGFYRRKRYTKFVGDYIEKEIKLGFLWRQNNQASFD